MHAGGADVSADQAGAATVLEQLAGLAFTPEQWERAILPARIPGYRPELLDLVCLSGQMIWAAIPDDGAPRNVPARVAFIPRRHPLFGPRENGEAEKIKSGTVEVATAEIKTAGDRESDAKDARDRAVLSALAGGGAQYLDQVADRADLSERDTLAALWRLAAFGRATNDSFAPLRMLAADASAEHAIAPVVRRAPTRHDAALRARLKSSLSGRWSAIIPAKPERDFDEMRERAMLLLERNGILSREMLALESSPVSWHDLSFALRRLEYGGTIRRGWFVRSLSAEQYALPEAVEMLRAALQPHALARKAARTQRYRSRQPIRRDAPRMRNRARGFQRDRASRGTRDARAAGARAGHGGRR